MAVSRGRVRCRAEPGESNANGRFARASTTHCSSNTVATEEDFESLFSRELKKRGMSGEGSKDEASTSSSNIPAAGGAASCPLSLVDALCLPCMHAVYTF